MPVIMKASVPQTIGLGQALYAHGIPADSVVPWLKARNYVNANVKYQATSVAYVVAGLELANNLIKSGKAKASKAKGIVLGD